MLRPVPLPGRAQRSEQASKGSFGLDIIQIDGLLTQLASFSSFSHSSVQKNPGLPNSRVEILKTLYSSLSPTEASFLTQIILKDLRPVLYPSKEMHYTAALKHQKSNSVVYLDVVDALKVWDPTLNVLSKWRVVSSFEVAMSGGNRGLTFVGNPLQVGKRTIRIMAMEVEKICGDLDLPHISRSQRPSRAQGALKR